MDYYKLFLHLSVFSIGGWALSLRANLESSDRLKGYYKGWLADEKKFGNRMLIQFQKEHKKVLEAEQEIRDLNIIIEARGETD